MWAECGQNMGRIWAEFGQNMGRIWAEYGQNMGRKVTCATESGNQKLPMPQSQLIKSYLCHRFRAKNGQNSSKMGQKWPKLGENCPKSAKIGQKWPKNG